MRPISGSRRVYPMTLASPPAQERGNVQVVLGLEHRLGQWTADRADSDGPRLALRRAVTIAVIYRIGAVTARSGLGQRRRLAFWLRVAAAETGLDQTRRA